MNLSFLDFVLSEHEVMFLQVCLNDGDSGSLSMILQEEAIAAAAPPADVKGN